MVVVVAVVVVVGVVVLVILEENAVKVLAAELGERFSSDLLKLSTTE